MAKSLWNVKVGEHVVNKDNGLVGVVLKFVPECNLYKDYVLIKWLEPDRERRIISGIKYWDPLVVVCENEKEILAAKVKYS